MGKKKEKKKKGLRYWVCQSCRQGGQVDYEKPLVCPECGKVGGKWKSSDVTNMDRFRTYECAWCGHSVDEYGRPKYPCEVCGREEWKRFKAD